MGLIEISRSLLSSAYKNDKSTDQYSRAYIMTPVAKKKKKAPSSYSWSYIVYLLFNLEQNMCFITYHRTLWEKKAKEKHMCFHISHHLI